MVPLSFQNKPNRCPDCRAARKAQRGADGGSSYGSGSYGGTSRGAREMFQTTCSQCGKTAEVPFLPRGDKPVYCHDCFQSRSSNR